MYKCVFKKEVYFKQYEIIIPEGLGYNDREIIEKEPILIKEKEIEIGMLNKPYLKIGDIVYIPDINKKVKINDVVKCLKKFEDDIEIIYYIEPEVKENGNIEYTRKACEKNLKNKLNESKKHIKLLESFQDEVKNNFWYRFMKKKVENKRFNKKVKTKI